MQLFRDIQKRNVQAVQFDASLQTRFVQITNPNQIVIVMFF